MVRYAKGADIMKKPRILSISFASVYPMYIQKAERKGRTKEEVDEIIFWLTGYDIISLQNQIDAGADMEEFFLNAPKINENAAKITGLVCGVRVEEIEDPTVQNIRRLDKLVDELANGKAMEKILRDSSAPSYTTVEGYISQYEGEPRARMEKLRALILGCSPDISENIAWGMATFILNGTLVHFSAQKKHLGLHPAPSSIFAFAERLSEYKCSKGTVQFPYEKPMPWELLREMVLFRVAEQKRGE
jgi:uncharacterized protein YdhG (YjbR/CyaY superfamily)